VAVPEYAAQDQARWTPRLVTEPRPAYARVAAVIVAYESGRHLGAAVEALLSQTVRPARIIVVDNASIDGAAESVARRYQDVELIRLDRNIGFAAASNLAVRRAHDCDWIALVNPDAMPAPDWLERLLDAAGTNPDFAFFASRLVSAEDERVLDGAGDAYHVSGFAWRRGHGCQTDESNTREVFSACAAAALYRRGAFLEVGGFDETFFCYFEDTDLAFRLRLTGRRCLYVDSAVATHAGSTSTGRSSDFTLFHQQRNATWTYLKNMPGPLALLYLPQHLLFQLLALVAATVRGQGLVVLRAHAAALRALPDLLRARRGVQSARAVSSLEVRRAMARGISGYLVGAGRVRTSARP
jgi:GT2 family glycosyltransferase